MMNDAEIGQFAARLQKAEALRTPIESLTKVFETVTREDAYQVQSRVIAARVAEGALVRGYKVGLTSVAMQQQMGVSEPDFGHLLDDMFAVGAISTDELCQPRVEPEIAFVLGEGLPDGIVNVADVSRATAYVTTAIEVIDSRYMGWKIKFEDTVADNGSSARVVLGATFKPLDGLNLRALGCVLRKNGRDVEFGSGAAVLGDPVNAVVWLANRLRQSFGIQLKAGDVLLSGSCTRAVDAQAGDTFDTVIDGLGSATVTFE